MDSTDGIGVAELTRRKNKRPAQRKSVSAASSKATGQKPRWRRAGSFIAAAILVPVVVAVTIWGAEKAISSALGTPKKSAPIAHPANDLCSRFSFGLQCTFNTLPTSDFVTRRSYSSLRGVPLCGAADTKESDRFLKWAAVNAIPGGTNFILDITSHARSIVNLGTTQISIIRRYPRLTTDDITCAGGADYSTAETIDLDTSPPKVTYFCGGRPCSVPLITLRNGDNLEVLIRTSDSRNVVEWTGKIEIFVNGHPLALNLGTHTSAPLPQPVECSPDVNAWLPCSSDNYGSSG
jgi:hypothetical protein